MLLIHITMSCLSLILHSMLLVRGLSNQTSLRLAVSTYASLIGAVGTGVVLLDGSAKGYAHGLGMIGVLGAFHVGLYMTRRSLVVKRAKQ